jgi:hypothetical protein
LAYKLVRHRIALEHSIHLLSDLQYLALVAFYIPATILVDMYWRHAKFGKLRFAAGIGMIAVLSYWISRELAAMNRGMYMVAPQTFIPIQVSRRGWCALYAQPWSRHPP